MKNVYVSFVLSALLMPILGHADAGYSWEKNSLKSKPLIEKSDLLHYHNRIVVFYPWHQAYERIKPNALYWGLEGWLAYIYNKEKNELFDSEFRMGYNFLYNGVDHLTPFAGVGYIKDFSQKHHHKTHTPGIVYGTLGFLYDHEFGAVFNLGIHLKGLLGTPVTDQPFDWGSPVMGADLAVPLTFRFGHLKHWDFRLEPFTTYLYGTEAYDYYVGSRCTLGYRF